MRPDDAGGPTPDAQGADLRRRAAQLRVCAKRGGALATALGTALAPAVKAAAGKGLWQGPFADRSTGQLSAWGRQLDTMASDLTASAAMWLREAERLEHEAGDLLKAAAPVPSGGR